MATRPPVSRLLVSPAVAAEVERVRIDLLIRTRTERTKTQVHDALIRIGLKHLDEVAALLTTDSTPAGDDPESES